MKKNKQKQKYYDDGHTIYNMDIDGMPHRRISKSNNEINLTKEERRQVIKAALARFMPLVFGMLLCFFLAMLLILLWLS